METLSSCGVRYEAAEIEPQNFAVVYGPGPVGLSMVQLLRNEGARVAVGSARATTGSSSAKHWAPSTSGNPSDESSPYHVPALAPAIKEANGGRLADRVLVATATLAVNQQAIEISGPSSIVVLMGLAGPNDTISVPLLSNLAQDKQ